MSDDVTQPDDNAADGRDDSHENDGPEDRLEDDALWDELAAQYKEETPTPPDQIAREVEAVRAAMAAFSRPPLTRYTVVDFLGVGGAGVVFRVWDTALLTYRALKLARPIEGKEDMVAGLLSEEISRLQEVSHPNVISIFDAGQLSSPSGPLPFYTMTFLRGALSASKYFASRRSTDQLFHFLQGLFSGVAHLHEAMLLHLDLKPSNVFVAEDGYAVVADLGGARQSEGDQSEELMITCTTLYAHPDLNSITAISTAGGDDNRRRGTVPRRNLRYAWDLYALGKTIFQALTLFERNSPGEISAYQRKYLHLQAARLLDGRNADGERPLGLTRSSLERLRYTEATRAQVDFEKLMGRVNPLTEIEELSPHNDSVIQVTRGQLTRMTPRLARLLREPLVRRLGSVSQLGLVRLVYPGATHNRLAHSLGCYSNAADYITSLYNDPINPLFRQVMTAADLKATLLAALLHDIGQYHHAHDLESVEPKVFRHETLTVELLKGSWHAFASLTDTLRQRLEGDWGISPSRIVEILEADPNRLDTDIVTRILHTVVSGPLDVDKLDYLIRDSDHCQTVFGHGLDRSRLLAILTVVYESQGGRDQQYFALGIHEKGRAAAEALGFIRFQMFRAVYWHHAVRSAKAMLQRAAFEWIAPGGRDPSQHDRLKRELHNHIMQVSALGRSDDTQPHLFEPSSDALRGSIGHSVRPQWPIIDHGDALTLEWLYERTSDVGKRLIQALSRRELYKRVFVVSKAQSADLWERMQEDLINQERVSEKSEALRGRLKRHVDGVLSGGPRVVITGVGEDLDKIETARRVLDGAGTLLLDVAQRRDREGLRFYPEGLHRGQREEFEAKPLLSVSDVWRVVSEQLHETAGSIRVFVHPDVDVLRSARREGSGEPIMGPDVIRQELRTLFEL